MLDNTVCAGTEEMICGSASFTMLSSERYSNNLMAMNLMCQAVRENGYTDFLFDN